MKKVELHELINIINKNDSFCVTSDQLNDNLTDLGMDSIAFIQIIVALEEKFDCEIPDSKLLMTEMDTVQKMFDVLRELFEEAAEM